MGSAYFYHLTRSPLEVMLPSLLARSLHAGWRVVVRGVSDARMGWLDEKLWQGPDDGFLPHGLAGGRFDADQPVLLTTAENFPNGAACLMSIDGANVAAGECRAVERVCVIFDGNEQASLDRARAQWQDLTGVGVSAQYWSEAAGRWQKKAEK